MKPSQRFAGSLEGLWRRVARRCLPVRALLLVLGLGCTVQTRGQAITNCSQAALEAALAEQGGVAVVGDCAIVLTNAIVVTDQVFLIGSGTNSSISASNRSRIFVVEAGGRLEVNDITLSGGRDDVGGAMYINENAEAVFSNCVFSANSALGADGTNGLDGADSSGTGGNGQPGGDGANAYGGVVFSRGNVTFLSCRFLGNSASGGNGGDGGTGGTGSFAGGNGGRGGNGGTGRGGAIYNAGDAFIKDCTLGNNSASGGDGGAGGLGGDGPEVGVTASGGSGAIGAGAAIFNVGIVEIVNCTFDTNSVSGGNSAGDGTLNGGLVGGDGYDGGAGLGGALCNIQTSTATNCTFSLNRATGGNGGDGGDGRFEAGDGGDGGQATGGAVYSSGIQWLINCTLSQNSVVGGTNGVAGSGPASGNDGRPGLATGAAIFGSLAGNFYYRNSIFAYSTGSTNGSGKLTGLGYNISDDSSVPLGAASFRKNPKLYTLADNGGPTLTMMLQADSPAAQSGTTDGAPEFDQRGFPRPATGDDWPDIGAVEVQPPVITNQPTSIMVAFGANATFTVGLTGDFPFVYKWKKDGTFISGATGSSYTVTNVSEASVGQYSVIVSNAAGQVESDPATLSVGTPIVITDQPVSQTVVPGVDVIFTVGATGTPPLVVQWRSNAVAIASATNWTLLLQNVQTNFSADYTAQITNGLGAVVSDVARLLVTAPPSISGPTLTGGDLNFVFPTATGITYVTEFNTSLSSTNWVPVATNFGTGLPVSNLYPATADPGGFFRLKAQ